MGQEKTHESGNGTSSLHSVWKPGEFSDGVSERRPEVPSQVPAMPHGARGRAAGNRAGGRGQKTANRGLESRVCEVCTKSFTPIPGEQWRKRCEPCYLEMRNAYITCPNCGERSQQKSMVVVGINLNPGKKDGKKLKVLYCQICFRIVRSRSLKLAAAQAAEIKKIQGDQRRRRMGQ